MDLKENTIANKSMYIPNYDTQNYPLSRLILLVVSFEHSASNKWKFTEVPKASEYENVIIKLGD